MVRATCPTVQWQAERARDPCVPFVKFATATTMSEQVVEERRAWASDIVWVALYSILVLSAHGCMGKYSCVAKCEYVQP
jgi:hypothetical protein